MGGVVSKFCTECFQSEEDTSIPLIETGDPESKNRSSANFSIESLETRVEENHPKQEYFFKIIEKATIEFLSHIRCPFEEEGFTDILSKDRIRVMSKDCESGYILKSEYFLNVKPDQFIELVQDVKNRKTWDDTLEKIELVASLPEDTSVVYLKYKKFLVVSSRDVLLVNRAMRAHNGLIFVSASCQLDEYPENSEAIRAVIESSGYYIEPTQDGKSRVIGFTIGNAGGKIPKAMVKTAAASALPKFIASLEKYIKSSKR